MIPLSSYPISVSLCIGSLEPFPSGFSPRQPHRPEGPISISQTTFLDKNSERSKDSFSVFGRMPRSRKHGQGTNYRPRSNEPLRKKTPGASKLPLSKSSQSPGGAPPPKFCRYCGKNFTDVAKYKAHEAYHSKADRFPCQFCDKAFHFKANLIRHERVHTGEKPYACSICGRKFTQISSCRSHESTHSH